MRITISGKQMELTDAIKDSVETKLKRLDCYLHTETEVKVTVSAKKARQKVEVTIIPISGPIIRAEDTEENLYAAIDVVYDKLNIQLRKYKKRVQDRHKSNESIRFNQIEDLTEEDLDGESENSIDIKIDRHKKFSMKPMSPEEAILQMDLLGHDFFMFTNPQDDKISIVYKRKNGGYGMIEQD
ncbi:ribosome-associated translation inhibitor RaiA [Paraclostridium sordellii 8483]|uniref:ribosome hibernation-promoting factor, HPF/YfiA family n=1 Tax=Paraclostridium sordellii TaxID=1505 RepID=UPI0002F34045|nr:ribosome-associated translation inhibitor RaiA [Paeniclostridium sordellii]TAN69543.1 ribosome-associated translation inhibitor RaiA [Paeniclostridium sordellii 8483]